MSASALPLLSLSVIVCYLLSKCDAAYPPIWRGRASIRNTSVSSFPFTGVVVFDQDPVSGWVTISGSFNGLPIGTYAMHIHMYGDISTPQAASTVIGTHFNALNTPHGCFPDTVRHTGDIGNITITTFPSSNFVIERDLLQLNATIFSIIGRAVIVHALFDHCDQPTGSAGGWIGQGVVGIASPNTTTEGVNEAMQVITGYNASAVIFPFSGSSTYGMVQFGTNADTTVRIVGTVYGVVVNGTHAVHVHYYGDDSSPTGANAGSHYDPFTQPHALPVTDKRHEGDMGNFIADANGILHIDASFDLLSLSSSAGNIIGRAVVVHAQLDDGSQPSGNAGARWGVGVIGLSIQPLPPPSVQSSSGMSSSTGGMSSSSTGGMSSSTGGMSSSSTSPSSTGKPSAATKLTVSFIWLVVAFLVLRAL